jgi:preprotein translocase subunit SecF
MLRIFHNATYDFIKRQKLTFILTAVFTIPGLLWIIFGGFKYSIEFTGGTLMQVTFAEAPRVDELRQTLEQAGVHNAEIQEFGSSNEFVIRAQSHEAVAQQAEGSDAVATEISTALEARYGAGSFEVMRAETVGPKVGSELRQKALYAILISFVVTLAYLAWRFEWRFGVAAVIATAHDILATLAFIKYLNLEISLVVVGGILTMIGYSLNDTIIIFDRIRENLRKRQKSTLYDLFNESVNETLPRSVLTHATTLATLLALTWLAGPVIRPFALVMLFGVFTGTFSSIFVASPILLYIEKKWPRAVGSKGGVGPRHRATGEPAAPTKRKTTAANAG